MLKDLLDPVVPARRVCAPATTCATCCEYELTVQRLREAYELLVQAMAAADRTKHRGP